MDWVGQARSNYFKVKDLEAFKAWAKRRDVDVIESEKDKGKVAVVSSRESVHGGWPDSIVVDSEGEAKALGYERGDPDDCIVEIDFVQELSLHLEDGQVAVLMEVGYEGQRYVTGWACAVNSKGERRDISLQAIYVLAGELGPEFTRAEY
jgi:hypothetical protein